MAPYHALPRRRQLPVDAFEHGGVNSQWRYRPSLCNLECRRAYAAPLSPADRVFAGSIPSRGGRRKIPHIRRQVGGPDAGLAVTIRSIMRGPCFCARPAAEMAGFARANSRMRGRAVGADWIFEKGFDPLRPNPTSHRPPVAPNADRAVQTGPPPAPLLLIFVAGFRHQPSRR